MNNIAKYRYIKYDTIQKALFYILFVVSFFSSALLMAYIPVLCLWVMFSRREECAVEAFIWIQLRSLVNPGIAVTFSGISSIEKWAAIFLLSGILIFARADHEYSLGKIYLLFVVYAIYLCLSALIVSSYPTVAVFKIVSYIIPFLAIVKGITDTSYVDWMRKIIVPLGIMIVVGIVLIRLPVGYLRNGYAFQGMFNHPNVFGVMLAMFLAGYLYLKKEYSLKEIIVSAVVVILAILSGSRTGMFSCLIAIALFLLSKDIRRQSKTKIWLTLIVIVLVAMIVTNESFITYINDLVFKGHVESLIYSRSNQFADNINRFLDSPLLGTGLNVPYEKGLTSYNFSFDLVVENGNLVLALLADTGIIGTILFVISYLSIFVFGIGNKSVIFIIPFVISMGEQSFFSTNNFGIILYIFIAIYLADGISRHSETVKNIAEVG